MRVNRTSRRTRAAAALVLLSLALATAPRANAADEDDDEPPMRLRAVSIEGNDSFSARRLRQEMRLQPRPWWAIWRARPEITDDGIRSDIARTERFYRARGFYQTEVRYETAVDPDAPLIDVRLQVTETEPVEIRDLHVNVDGERLAPEQLDDLVDLPLAEGDPFDEDPYRAGEEALRNAFLARGHARVQVQRNATVDIHTRLVRVVYEVLPGPVCVFGTTTIEGEEKVARYIIEREIHIQPGDPFNPEAIADARGRLLDLGLFGVVRIVLAEPKGDSAVIDLNVYVEERPPRSVSLGVGYGTDDKFRIQASWAHRNFLGDGRQLSVRAKYSSLLIAGGVELMQPHFFSPRNRLVIEASHDQLDEESYLVNETRFRPRIERSIGSDLTVALACRLARVDVQNVDAATTAELDLRDYGLISGPALSFVFDTADNELDPRRGTVATAGVKYSDGIWGASFHYYGLWSEVRQYVPLPLAVVLALRASAATVDPLGDDNEVPIHERLYSGGDGSIRGYGRLRLGPLSASDDPLGGLSRIEGSFELRRRIWGPIGGAVFVEAGDVSLDSYDFRFAQLQPAAGAGISYVTPVGPLRLDVGFPFDPPGDDPGWRVHFSVGQYF